MKVTLNTDGRIDNFYDDGYITGNEAVILHKVKGFAPDVDLEEVAKNNTRVKGCFIYYLENGIVKKLTLEEQPEYKEWLDRKKKEQYETNTDGIILKAVRELLKDNTFRSKLSSETQQLLASAEMKIEQIKRGN